MARLALCNAGSSGFVVGLDLMCLFLTELGCGGSRWGYGYLWQ